MNLRELHTFTLDELIRLAEASGLFEGAVRVGDKVEIPVGTSRVVLSETEALTFFRGAIRRHLMRTGGI